MDSGEKELGKHPAGEAGSKEGKGLEPEKAPFEVIPAGKPEAQSPEASAKAGETEEKKEEVEIARIKKELGLPVGEAGLLEDKEKLLSTEGKFERTRDFLGIKESAVSRAKRLESLDKIDSEKLERLHQLALLAQEGMESREELRILGKIFDLTTKEAREVVDTISAWTEDHSLRLTILGSRVIDRLWPFDDEFKKSFWNAGLLHDLGKASTPKGVLDKETKLTDEDWKVIRRHPVNGERLLSNIERFDRFVTQGTHHHEKIGGGGYSHGTEGEGISFVGRVLGVVDVYDALLDFRPYKQAYSQERAIRSLEEGTCLQSALDERGAPVLDKETHEPLMRPVQFDRLPVAHLVTMYENRELNPQQYFDADREEKKFIENFEKVSPYAHEKNLEALEEDKKQLLSLLSPALSRIRVASPKDLVDSINSLEREKIETLESLLTSKLGALKEERDKFQDIYVDALFLLVKCIDARYQAYYEGMPLEGLSGGEERTSNVVRYSLMLAQQMELSWEEQKKIAMAAMFCDIGVLGADEDKVRNPEVLGVSDYEELKKIPEIGYRILRIFMEDREVAPYFEGADIGAAEANLWANGKGGYGVRLNSNGEPSLIGEIVGIAHKYTALRTKNPYRGEGLSHDRAMAIMRRGVGREFDREVWEQWEKLYARDTLRVFKERPEVVGQVKKLFRGEIPQITFLDETREKLASFMEKIQEAEDEKEKMELCFEAAEYAGGIGFFSGMERFFELAEPIALRLGDERIISLMEKLYDYDLEKAKEQELSTMRRRLKDGEVIKAIGAVESLVIDFAEKGQSISKELAREIREEVIPVYKDFVERKIQDFRRYALVFDKDALSGLREQIARGIKEIGDDVFEAGINKKMEEIEQEVTMAEIKNYIKSIEEFTAERNDPFNGEHYIAAAEKLMKTLKPKGRALMIEELARASRALYRRGHTVAFDKLQREAEAGNVHVVLALKEKIKEWMKEAGEEKVISEEKFGEAEKEAYRRGIEKMKELLARDDLGLYDVARVERWVKNISSWQKEVSGEQIGEEELGQLRHRALERVRDNLPKEIEEALKSDDQRTLKDMVITVAECIVRPNEEILLTSELYRQMGEVRDHLFEIFVDSIQEKISQGKAKEVRLAVGHFRNFCGGEGRNEIVPLKDEQVQRLKEIELEAHRNSLAVRIENIAGLGATEMLSRLEKELARLREDEENFEHMGGEIDKRVFNLRINEAVYGSFVSKITSSIKEGDIKGFSFVFGRLQDLIEKGTVEERAESLEALKEVSLPFIQESFSRLAKAGDLDSFEALEKVTAFGGTPQDAVVAGRILEENEAKKLSAELEPVKRECYQNRIKQLSIQLKIYGVKSQIGAMRIEEDKLHRLKERAPELVDNLIFEKSQQEAERIVNTYRTGVESCKLLGGIGINGRKHALAYTKRAMGELHGTRSGYQDFLAFERIVDEV